MKGREQAVIYNGSQSKFKKVDRGMPQGAVLSPTLFNFLVSEIPDLEAHSFCEEQVSKLQVSVDHLVFMNVLHCLHQLINIESSFHLVESFASLNQIRERLVLADVQHDVDVLLVLKVSVKSNDVFVVERAVDFDLTSKFLASFGPR